LRGNKQYEADYDYGVDDDFEKDYDMKDRDNEEW